MKKQSTKQHFSGNKAGERIYEDLHQLNLAGSFLTCLQGTEVDISSKILGSWGECGLTGEARCSHQPLMELGCASTLAPPPAISTRGWLFPLQPKDLVFNLKI